MELNGENLLEFLKGKLVIVFLKDNNAKPFVGDFEGYDETFVLVKNKEGEPNFIARSEIKGIRLFEKFENRGENGV